MVGAVDEAEVELAAGAGPRLVRVEPIRWAETEDGVLIEWVNRGTLNGMPFELRGADRYTLRDGKAAEGYAYFNPCPFVEAAAATAT